MNRIVPLLLLVISLTAMSIAQNSAPQPPVAKKIHTERTMFGATLVDDYAWLRDRKNPEVKALLEAENAYTEQVMKPTLPLQQKLYDEIVGHIKESDDSVPYLKSGFYYYTRTEKGKQYFVVCRKKGSIEAPEEVLLDLNKMGEGEKFMSLGSSDVSDDGNLLAYTTDNVGFRQYKMHVRDLRTGQDLADKAERVTSLAWAADNKTIFYVVEDAQTKRSYRLYRHTVGTDTANDTIVYEDKDERFDIGVHRSRSGEYLFLTAGSHITSEVQFLKAGDPAGAWKMIEPRKDNVEYFVEQRGDEFYIRTNDSGPTYRLVTAPIATPGKAHWKELVAARPDVPLDGVQVFQDFYVLNEREHGLTVFRVVQFAGGPSKTIQFPEPTYFVRPQDNAEFNTGAYRYGYQSLVTPPSVYDYDVKTQTSKLLKQNDVPGGFDRNNYASERIEVPAADGVRIPVSLFYRKGIKRESSPIYIYAYGSYGYPLAANFSAARLPLVDRGFVVALVHIRGGGDLGKPWHDAGKMMNKRNTFTDFITATEYLVNRGYGAKDKVAIEGGSAGGLLMGAVTNMRPELFRVVLCMVPFVDVMNTMLDSTLPLTVPEYEEWGNPNEEKAFNYMLSYSPYDNLRKRAYPSILVRTSFDDSQVMYWEPAKYVAKLRTLKTDSNPLLFYVNMHGGHGGSSGRYDKFKETAFNYAFMFTQLGVEETAK